MANRTKRHASSEQVHRLLTGIPEAQALREAATAWVFAGESKLWVDFYKANKTIRDPNDEAADLANRRLLSAAVDFTHAIGRLAARLP